MYIRLNRVMLLAAVGIPLILASVIPFTASDLTLDAASQHSRQASNVNLTTALSASTPSNLTLALGDSRDRYNAHVKLPYRQFMPRPVWEGLMQDAMAEAQRLTSDIGADTPMPPPAKFTSQRTGLPHTGWLYHMVIGPMDAGQPALTARAILQVVVDLETDVRTRPPTLCSFDITFSKDGGLPRKVGAGNVAVGPLPH